MSTEQLTTTVTRHEQWICRVCGTRYEDRESAEGCSTKVYEDTPVPGVVYVKCGEGEGPVYLCGKVEPYVETTYKGREQVPTGRPTGTCKVQVTFTRLGDPYKCDDKDTYTRGMRSGPELIKANKSHVLTRLKNLHVREADRQKTLDTINRQINELDNVIKLLSGGRKTKD